MPARLYVIPGSHPSMAARLMIEHKAIPYRRIDLIPVVAKPILRALGFPRATVPALAIDGRRTQGSRQIARALEELRPEPPLFPSDPGVRDAVEEAERWGDEVLQPVPRRIVWWCLKRDREPLAAFAQGARLGIPVWLALKTAGPIVRLAARLNAADDPAVRADLAALPKLLDNVDSWIGDGVIGGGEPNAADFQIATSVRLIMRFDDLAPLVEGRPAAELARRLVPDLPGRFGPILPPDWVPAARAARQASIR